MTQVDPLPKPALGKACKTRLVRPNNSLKPSPLRGLGAARYDWSIANAAQRPGLAQALAIMKRSMLLGLLILLPLSSRASHIEGCDLEGEISAVQVVHPTLFKKKYRVMLKVVHSTESENDWGRGSYIKCSRYEGRDMLLEFYAYRKHVFQAGDRIVVQRTVLQFQGEGTERVEYIKKLGNSPDG